ncbi:MAG TPA: hypothetical protein VI789_05825 [Dehalococcoidia bacterium]|nr:hypothetical protein [Dehalococcoidia bacterium]
MLNWLRRGRGSRQSTSGAQVEPTPCAHLVLMPRWDALEHMGKAELATGYKCDACGHDLTREEGQEALQRGSRLFGT